MMPDNTSFLSVGECMVELSPAGGANYKLAFAGDTFNTAWYVRRLLGDDWRVSYLSATGDDPVSERMVSFIRDSGIYAGHIARVKGKAPGLYMIHLDQGERSFSYWRDTSAARMLADDPLVLKRAMQGAGVIYFSGITMAILPAQGRRNLLDALRQARADGRQIVFDPNLRPALWADRETMCGEIHKAASVADIVLPSFDDETRFFADKAPQDTISRYLALGATLVVVKNGADEVLAKDARGGQYRHRPEPVEFPADTTAAGDSFNAAFLAALLSGADVGAALRSGSEFSAKVIQKRGALVKT